MFQKYNGIIDINKVLKDEYDYEYDGSLEDFYAQDFIELEGDGVTAMCWISFGDSSYLFKPIEDSVYNIWGELLSQEMALRLGIPCAEYRLAIFNNQLGVITKQMLKENERLILGCEVFQKFLNDYPYKKNNKPLLEDETFISLYQIPEEFNKYDAYNQRRYLFNHFNNLEQVWAMLEMSEDIASDDRKEIADGLRKMLLFDILTLQGDRHPNNWAIIKDDNSYKLSLVFDNAVSFGLGYPFMKDRANNFRNEIINSRFFNDDDRINKMIYQSRPNFTLSQDNIIDVKKRTKDIGLKVLDDYLKISDESGQALFYDLFGKIDIEMLDDIIETAENKNGLRMEDEAYGYIHNVFEIHFNNIKSVISKYQKGSVVSDETESVRKI